MATLAPSTIDSVRGYLKQSYESPEKIANVMIAASVLVQELLDKAKWSLGGEVTKSPIAYGSGGGVSSAYTAAFVTSQPASVTAFLVTRSTCMAVGMLSGEAIAASEGIENGFEADVDLELDMKRRRFMQQFSFYVLGDGTGTVGQISTSQTLSSTTLTLADASTAIRFNINDQIQIAATVGAANRTAGTGTAVTLTSNGPSYAGVAFVVGVTVTGPNAGQIQLSATKGGSATALNTLWQNVAQGDFIYFVGDAGTPVNVANTLAPAIVQGIMAWCPAVAPISSDSFFSVNRYLNQFLYGQVIDATSAGLNLGSIREALTYTVGQLHQVSALPSLILLNPVAFYNLSISMVSQAMFPGSNGQGPDEGSLGFSELYMPTPHGTIRVVSDTQVAPFLNPASFDPNTGTYSGAMTAYVLEEETWEIIGKNPNGDGIFPFLDKTGSADGSGLITYPGSDVYFFALKGYVQLQSRAPNHNAICLLPAS